MSAKRKLDEYNEVLDATRDYGSKRPKDSSLPIKTYRMSNIPLGWTISNIDAWLQSALGVSEFNRGVAIRTFAINHDQRSKVATISFRQRPSLLDQSSSEWKFPVVVDQDEDSRAMHIVGDRPMIYIDDHFHGFTVLCSYDQNVEHSNASHDPLDLPNTVQGHQMDLVAISGLGGHAFGSFKERGGSHMWLADALPKHLPGVRILIYGYDTKLEANNSFQSFEGLASAFRLKLSSVRQGYENVPLVFLAHSLGGIVVKEAMIQLWRDKMDRKMLNLIYGMIFFGVPSQGMDIESLVPIVDDQPNEFMLHALGRESPALRAQRREFNEVIKDRELELFCFYESSLSPTAVCQNGVLKMAGPLKLLVGSFSATDGAPDSPLYIQELKRDHSSIVKFSDNDDEYQLVLQVLKRFHAASTQTGNKPLTPDENACLRTLSFPEMSKRLSTIDVPLAGTCHWLCEKDEYRSWLEGRSHTNQVLWIKGKPGAGKSTLLKHALTCLESQAGLKSSYTYVSYASFFFNARGVDLERNSAGMFRGLLHQLFQTLPALRSQIMKKYNEKKETMSTWSWHREELQNLLTFVLSLPRKYEITIFVDAFDECQSEKEARELVLYFKRLISATAPGNVKLRVCLSSRHYPNFPDHDCRQIWVEDNNHRDIERYIRDRLGEDYALEAKPSGVFLWVVLIVPELAAKIHGLTTKRRKKLIQDLPPELDDIYKRQLDSVKEKRDPQALAIMRWVLFSLQPLRLSELRNVLGFSNETPCQSLAEWHSSDEFPESNKLMFHLMQELSGGLLETRGEHKDHDADADLEVQLIHESVRDFLIRSNGLCLLGFTDSVLNDGVHEDLKRFCIYYLTMSELRTGFWNFEEDVADFPFLKYACQHLLLHASSAEAAGVSQEHIFQQLNHLNDQTYCWQITKDGAGSVVAQGSLSTVIASQDKLLAILEDADRFGLTSYEQISAIPGGNLRHQPDRHIHVVGLKLDQRLLPDFAKSSVSLGLPSKDPSKSIGDFQTLLKYGIELQQPVDVSNLLHDKMGVRNRTAEMRYVLTGRRPIISAEAGALGLCIWADEASLGIPGASTPDAMDTEGPFEPTQMPKSFYPESFYPEQSHWPLAGRNGVGSRPIPEIVVTMDDAFET